jgi:hypothetical protein
MEQSNMINTVKTCILLFMIIPVASAENAVFTDAAFPYRIVCKTGWIQETKNDSLFVLKNTASGKKTRLQLQKYSIDTGYDFTSQDWSRLHFAVNKELASNIGQLMWFDSLPNKKLGNYRAFEICAFFSEKSATGTIWWGEYSRWTDHGGFGYLASIIGDTADIRANTTAIYKALLDSISISQLGTGAISHGPGFPKAATQRFSIPSSTWYNALGRYTYGTSRQRSAILVKKDLKQLLMR